MAAHQHRTLLLLGLALAGCGGHQRQPADAPRPADTTVARTATPVEAPPLPTAPDSLADALLVDIRSVDSTIQIDVRYAGPNNFTGAPALMAE